MQARDMITARRNQRMRLYTAKLANYGLAVLLLGLGLSASQTQARDAYIPYVESLQVSQKRAYVQAAPSGQDEALASTTEPLILPAGESLPAEPSRLEEIAEQKAGVLTLDDSQQSQALTTGLSQFGYDIFSRVPSTFAQLEGIPVPANYRIGPGDHIIVQLYGKRNVEYKLVVTRDGNILVPEYGPVKVAGLSFDEAEQLLTEGFERRVIGARAVVTMGKLRTIQIRLAGDASQPGIYTVGGLSTLIDALLASGGIKSTGSLRNIQLIRAGKTVTRLDLYDLLLRGSSDADVYLQHNDTIFIPPISAVIYVGGEVQRPAIYEISDETSVKQIIDMAGGLLPTASLTHSHIERIQDVGTRTLIDFSTPAMRNNEDKILNTGIRNGDLLRILPLEDELKDVVLLSGHVKRPGGYQFRPGMRLSDLISDAVALLPGADVDFVLIKREQKSTLRTEIIYGNLMQALAAPGGNSDTLLQARDRVVVFNLGEDRAQALKGIVSELDVQATDYRPARVIAVSGSVRHNGRLPLQENASLLDAVALAGGSLPGTDLHYGVIARTNHPGTEIDVLSFSLADALNEPASPANIQLAAGDRLYFFDDELDRSKLLGNEIEHLREQASYGADENLVSVMGQVLHPGIYPLETGMRASDLLCAARGLTRKAYGLGAALSRVQRNAATDNNVTHTVLDSSQLLQLCDYSRKNAKADSKGGGTDTNAISYNNDLLNPVLKPMDQLIFTEKPGWVERASITLAGEVQLPGVYAIDRGETLCEVLARAGGLTKDAYSFGAYFTRRSVRQMQQKTLDELHDQLDDLMVELSLSHSFNNEEKSAPEWGGKQDYLKTIQQLERAEATGRMVVDLNKVLKCRDRDALVLEDGDRLEVPRMPNFVQVSGQVYVPTSHLYADDRNIEDYVELSGGHTVLGRMKDTYVIQPNGEVLNFKGSRSSSRIARSSVMPGARIYVPLNVDRMNGTEKAQTWVSSLVQSAILAGIVL